MYSTHNEGKSVVAERFIRALNNIRGENLCQLYNTLHYQLDMKGTRFLVFFLSGFSFTETDDSQDSRERKGGGTSFISLYHFHLLTNIQAFICNFTCEMTITYI